MPYANGLATAQLVITPADGTTTVEVAIAGPEGASATATPTSTDGGTTWTVSWVPSVAGLWIVTWDVDGTGEGIAPQKIYVTRAPTPAEIVAWRPELEDVAAYVPSATLVGAVDGYGNIRYTFDDSGTHPRASSVHRLITDACSWVLLATGDLDATLADGAKGLAARRAAGWAQFNFVDDADDRAHAEALLKQTEAELKQLAARNTDLTGEDPTSDADELKPEFWFPRVDTWYC